LSFLLQFWFCESTIMPESNVLLFFFKGLS
jgi:hypothetical protein